jgi:hypothetical protein
LVAFFLLPYCWGWGVFSLPLCGGGLKLPLPLLRSLLAILSRPPKNGWSCHYATAAGFGGRPRWQRQSMTITVLCGRRPPKNHHLSFVRYGNWMGGSTVPVQSELWLRPYHAISRVKPYLPLLSGVFSTEVVGPSAIPPATSDVDPSGFGDVLGVDSGRYYPTTCGGWSDIACPMDWDSAGEVWALRWLLC